MSIECYYAQCKNHADHYGTTDGPFCELGECTATKQSLELFAKERKGHLESLNTPEQPQYFLPAEVKSIMADAWAYKELRDIYSRRPFGFNKAIKASKKHGKLRASFWSKVYRLYPELVGKTLTYTTDTGLVEETK